MIKEIRYSNKKWNDLNLTISFPINYLFGQINYFSINSDNHRSIFTNFNFKIKLFEKISPNFFDKHTKTDYTKSRCRLSL